MSIKEAIDKLNSMDTASFLEDCRNKNIKGEPTDCRSCLIAQWIKNYIGVEKEPYIKVNSRGAVYDNLDEVWYDLNYYYRQIIEDFDEHRLTEFEV